MRNSNDLTSKVIARDARLERCRRKGEAAHDVEEAEPLNRARDVIRRAWHHAASPKFDVSLDTAAPFYVFIKGRWG